MAKISMSKQINVRVIPRAKKTEITSTLADGTLKIKLKAPPVDGKANEELVRFLSEEFGVARSKIEIVRGEKGRNKIVKLS